MFKKFAMLVALMFVATTGVAHAGNGYSDEDILTADQSTYAPGEPGTFVAKTFEAGSPVTFTLFSSPVVLGTVTANASGVATLTASIPTSTPPGPHTIEASGTGSDGLPLTVSTRITVAEPGGGGNLPRTGSDSTLPLTQMGVAAVAVGGLLVLVTRKRRSASV